MASQSEKQVSRGSDSASEDLVRSDRRHLWHPFTQEQTAPDPIAVVSGRGTVLHGADGREYLDLISSWWVTTHGHAHPAIAKAIADQATRLEQVIFAGFTHPPAVHLAEKLIQHLPKGFNRVFYSDDGSTAVEVSLKMALQYARNSGEKRTRFLAFEGGYHGDTVGAMTAGRASGFFDLFDTMLFEMDYLPYPATWQGDEDIETKEAAALKVLDDLLEKRASEYAALIVEPLIQGASGMRICRPAFLQEVATRLKAAGVLLIFDEVMTGFGRTGTLFASERAGVTPDIICLSKALTAGFLPLSVTACSEEIYQRFLGEAFDKALAHGHSFTANPLGCAAAIASLEIFERDNVLGRIGAIEKLHGERLAALKGHAKARHLRHMGIIAALDVVAEKEGYTSEAGPRLKAFFLEKGLLIRPLGNVVYLFPPYCATDDELHRGWDAIAEALDSVV